MSPAFSSLALRRQPPNPPFPPIPPPCQAAIASAVASRLEAEEKKEEYAKKEKEKAEKEAERKKEAQKEKAAEAAAVSVAVAAVAASEEAEAARLAGASEEGIWNAGGDGGAGDGKGFLEFQLANLVSGMWARGGGAGGRSSLRRWVLAFPPDPPQGKLFSLRVPGDEPDGTLRSVRSHLPCSKSAPPLPPPPSCGPQAGPSSRASWGRITSRSIATSSGSSSAPPSCAAATFSSS